MVITPEEKKMTAYHEAGHALVGMFTPGSDHYTKSPSCSRHGAWYDNAPTRDGQIFNGMNEYEAHIAVLLGGKVAEEMIYGSEKVSSGVANVRIFLCISQ